MIRLMPAGFSGGVPGRAGGGGNAAFASDTGVGVGVGIVDIVAEVALDLDILFDAFVAMTLVALLAVLPAQRL